MDFPYLELLVHLFLTGYPMNCLYSTHFQTDHRILSNNSKFWKSISPLFSKKAFHNEHISFLSKYKIISEETKLVERFNNYFSNTVKNLRVQNEVRYDQNFSEIPDPILNLLETRAAMFTDLSKAFNCINHDLLIPKLTMYGFRYESLDFLQISYL